MQMQPSQVHKYMSPRALARDGVLKNFKVTEDSFRNLHKLGIGLDAREAFDMLAIARQNARQQGVGMDAIAQPQPLVTTATIPSLIQFLQGWLPGSVRVVTAARKADLLTGVKVIGSWEDEQIVWKEDELTGNTIPYADASNTPYANYNVEFNSRTVIRFELGMLVGLLQQARMSRIQISDDAERRQAVIQKFEITRNQVAFNGYNAGNNRTYGILNDPNLPNYVTFPNGASSSPLWSTKTFLEITKDIILMVNALVVGAADLINAHDDATTLALATNTITYLDTLNTLGTQSVAGWIKDTYPKMRVISCPEFNVANSGANVVYLYAENFTGDGSTDGGMAWDQLVPMKFKTLGVKPEVKGYKESYTNALAGVAVYRPWMFVRYSGN